MKITLQSIITTIPFKKIIIGSLLVNLTVVVLVFATKNSLPPVVPLLYGLPQGQDQLVNTNFLVMPAIFSIAIIAANTLLIKIVDNDFIQKVFLGLIITSTSLSTIAIIRVMLLVGSF